MSPHPPRALPLREGRGTGYEVPRGLVWWEVRPSATAPLGKPLSSGAGAVTAPTLPPAPQRFLSVGGKRERSRHPEQKWLSRPCWRRPGHVRRPGSRSPSEATARDVPEGAGASHVTSPSLG